MRPCVITSIVIFGARGSRRMRRCVLALGGSSSNGLLSPFLALYAPVGKLYSISVLLQRITIIILAYCPLKGFSNLRVATLLVSRLAPRHASLKHPICICVTILHIFPRSRAPQHFSRCSHDRPCACRARISSRAAATRATSTVMLPSRRTSTLSFSSR